MATPNSENIESFRTQLINWYFINGRSYLPWRKDSLTAYQLIIAEILLQRTKAETIFNFYPIFLNKFPDWESIVTSDISIIEKSLQPIGLYKQRASRLKKLAIEMKKRNGKFPIKRSELEAIPFMGQYITNSVELLIHKIPSFLLDTNMARVFERYFEKRLLSDIRYDPYLQKLSFDVVNHKQSKIINWAILDFASLVCKARNPLCSVCSLAKNCTYFLENTFKK